MLAPQWGLVIAAPLHTITTAFREQLPELSLPHTLTYLVSQTVCLVVYKAQMFITSHLVNLEGQL